MVDCIQCEGGMLDKFIGDAIMAAFGVPVANGDDEDRAVRAAVSMMRELPINSLQALARNRLRRPRRGRITIYHDESHPSRLDLPITRGNLIGTFFSGGDVISFGLSR